MILQDIIRENNYTAIISENKSIYTIKTWQTPEKIIEIIANNKPQNITVFKNGILIYHNDRLVMACIPAEVQAIPIEKKDHMSKLLMEGFNEATLFKNKAKYLADNTKHNTLFRVMVSDGPDHIEWCLHTQCKGTPKPGWYIKIGHHNLLVNSIVDTIETSAGLDTVTINLSTQEKSTKLEHDLSEYGFEPRTMHGPNYNFIVR